MSGPLQIPLHPDTDIYRFLVSSLPLHLQAIFQASSGRDHQLAIDAGRAEIGRLLIQNRGAHQQLCVKRNTVIRNCKALPPGGALCSVVCVAQSLLPSHYVQLKDIDSALHLVGQEGQYLACLHSVFTSFPQYLHTGARRKTVGDSVVVLSPGEEAPVHRARGRQPADPLEALATSQGADPLSPAGSSLAASVTVIDEIAPESSPDN